MTGGERAADRVNSQCRIRRCRRHHQSVDSVSLRFPEGRTVSLVSETALTFLGLELLSPIAGWIVLLTEALNINVVALVPG